MAPSAPTRTFRPLLTLALLAFGASGCESTVRSSDLMVNGERFGPHECRSGQQEEFNGVDLSDGTGKWLRIASNVDNSVSVVVFEPGVRPAAIVGCTTLHLSKSARDKRGRYKVSGDATMACSGDGVSVTGSVFFDDCGLAY